MKAEIKKILKTALPEPVYTQLKRVADQKRENTKIKSPFFKNYPPQMSATMIESRTLISHDYKFFYSRIPKAANSTVVGNLMSQGNPESFYTIDEINHYKQQFPSLTNLTFEEIELVLSKYFKFIVVRHPGDRVISAFRDKIHKPGKMRGDVENFLSKQKDETINLSEFIDYLGQDGALHSNPHWAPQCDIAALEIDQYDFIGRIESLDTDLDYIMKQVFSNEGNIKTYAPHSTGSTGAFMNVESELRKKIFSLYEEDFDALEYVAMK